MDLSAGIVGSEVDAMAAATAEEDAYTSIYPANSRMTKSMDGNILKSRVLRPRRRSADIDDIERNFRPGLPGAVKRP